MEKRKNGSWWHKTRNKRKYRTLKTYYLQPQHNKHVSISNGNIVNVWSQYISRDQSKVSKTVIDYKNKL